MKTLILKPNGKESQYQGTKKLSAIEPPLWALLLCNYYKTNLIVDAEVEKLTIADTVENVLKYQPDEIKIICTGSHPSAYIQQQEVGTDLKNLFDKFELNSELITQLPADIEDLGMPDWDLIPIGEYQAHNWHCFGGIKRKPYGVVYTSIGCPYSCSFCSIKNWYGTIYKERPIKNIIKDFKALGKRGVKNIKIMDELFALKKDRVKEICKSIVDLRYDFNIWTYARIDTVDKDTLIYMKKAGINWIAYGIETGSERIRNEVLKGKFSNQDIKDVVKMTKDIGINVLGNYMFGFWEDNEDTMSETLDLAFDLNCEYSNFYCLVAYPNTPLYKKMKEKGIDLPDKYSEYAQMSKSFKPLPTKYLSAEDVLKFRDDSFNEYFSSEGYLKMMKKKFGKKVLDEINEMTKVKVERNGKKL
jgi:radical SAM superfamily enzyme YgiQ (UPF0313 family)